MNSSSTGVRAALLGVALCLPSGAGSAPADSAATKAGPPPKTMTMAEAKEKLGLVVFPAKEQTPAQQEEDELACLTWSAEQVHASQGKPADPKAAGKEAAAQVDSAAAGAAVKGAAKGAAVGAIMGSFYGNSESGAAWGAAGGAVAGRRAKRKAEQKAQADAEKKVAAENEKKVEALRKGMAACLESRGYTVK